jgi:hypothetical protein
VTPEPRPLKSTRLLRRRARGYRVVDYFKLMIFQACSLLHDPRATVIL